jgi:oleandomycin transport system permease protein
MKTIRDGLRLAWRALLKIKHSPDQLFDISLTPIMFVTLFVFLFGTAVAGDWHRYLQFVLPGVAVQSLIFASMGTAVGLNADLRNGIFDRFRSLPIARTAPLIGHVLGDFFRYVVTIVITLAYGLILGYRFHGSATDVFGALGLMVLFSFAMSWPATIIGTIAPNVQSVQGYAFLIMFPLTFGSNIFVPTGKLPGWLQAWVKVNPVTALSNAVRGLMEHQPVGAAVSHAVLWSLGIIAVFGPLAGLAYRRKVT